jgi:hypothetical protein
MYTDISLMQTLKLNESSGSLKDQIQRKSSNPCFVASITNLDNYD